MKSNPSPKPSATPQSNRQDAVRSDRRRLIKATLASVPLVLTVTAGTAKAQTGGSAAPSSSSSGT